jgi:hypothetical protein
MFGWLIELIVEFVLEFVAAVFAGDDSNPRKKSLPHAKDDSLRKPLLLVCTGCALLTVLYFVARH